MKIYFIFIFFPLFWSLNAQVIQLDNLENDDAYQPEVQIKEDVFEDFPESDVGKSKKQYYYFKKEYTIQLYTGLIYEHAIEKKNLFERYYISLKTDIIYKNPYYKVYVGNFQNIIDANKMLTMIKDCFDTVYIKALYKEKIYIDKRDTLTPIPILPYLSLPDNNKVYSLN